MPFLMGFESQSVACTKKDGCYGARIDVDVRNPPSVPDRSSKEYARLRQRSKLLFGNQDRLEVLVAIARSPDGLVNATDLQWEIGIAQSRVRSQLISLARVGLLSASQVGGKRWYKRRNSPIWDAALALLADWTA